MDRSEVAIIIPAFNEEKTIAKVIEGVREYGTPIVVNDFSTDNTANVATKCEAIVVNHERNKGYDRALNSGFEKSSALGCKFVITFDGDGQHPVELIKTFLCLFEEGVDLVIGSRPNSANIAECLFAFVAKLRFGIRDPLCGMKGYSMEIYKALGHFDSYGSIGSEMAFFGIKNNFRFKEVQVIINRRHDKSRFYSSFWGNIKILRSLVYSFIRV